MASEFIGWSDEALDLLEQAEAEGVGDAARRDAQEKFVRAPTAELCDALAAEFGPAHVWHLHRDPYLWRNQGAELEVADRVGLGVRLSLAGLAVWGGMMRLAPSQLAAYRGAALDGRSGPRLARAVATLVRGGWTLDGDTMKTAPRGVTLNHPRLELLRHREVVLRRQWPVGAWLSTAEPLDRVRKAWADLGPVLTWFAQHLDPTHAGAADVGLESRSWSSRRRT